MSNPIWKKLQNGFHDGINGIKNIFTIGESKALELATAAAHYVEQNGGQVLRDAATAGVSKAQEAGGTGVEKASLAFEAIVAVLKAKGLPVVTAAINLAIEMALAEAKQAGLIN